MKEKNIKKSALIQQIQNFTLTPKPSTFSINGAEAEGRPYKLQSPQDYLADMLEVNWNIHWNAGIIGIGWEGHYKHLFKFVFESNKFKW